MNTVNDFYFAAIDLGTNSCRLAIADAQKNYVFSDALSPRLGEGMYPQMKFTPEAVERGVQCFYKLKQVMNQYNIVDCRAIATASCRMAKNADEFIKRVYDESLIKIEVIDGYEEARLNLKGALEHVCGKTPYVVLYDLGGGSTEITLAENTKNPKILHTVSIPWGARNASEAFDLVEYDSEKAQKLEQEIAGYVDRFVKDAELDEKRGQVCFVSTSSTPLRFVSMIKKFGRYDRDMADGHCIKCTDIDKQIARIYTLNRQQLLEDDYIGKKRSFIFTAASVIFKTIYDRLGADELTASLKSAKDGILDELIENYNKKDTRQLINKYVSKNGKVD